jgi:hypothetical protein
MQIPPEQQLGQMLLGLLIILIYFIPTLVAFHRDHAYRFVITVINICTGWTGIGYLAALLWAVWPADRALAEPLIGNVTGTGNRNLGDVIGEGRSGFDRSLHAQSLPARPTRSTIEEDLRQLKRLFDDGLLSHEEFELKRRNILGL